MATSPPEQPPIMVFTITIPTAAESPSLVMLSCKIVEVSCFYISHCEGILLTSQRHLNQCLMLNLFALSNSTDRLRPLKISW